MTGFTILGLLIFWIWCFQIGYWLIPTAHTLYALVLLELTTRRIGNFAAHIAALHAMEQEPTHG